MKAALGAAFICVSAAPRSAAARPQLEEPGAWLTVSSPHITVNYPADTAAQSAAVLSGAESLFAAYADLFGEAPEAPVTVRLYGRLDAFLAANPLAVDDGEHLAYARRRARSIELAVPAGGRQGEEGLAGDLRYEMAHLFVLQLAKGKLPPLWQEGVAWQVARDTATAAGVARLREAVAKGSLYRWPELAAAGAEYLEPRLAYAEVRSVAHWLADAHGQDRLFRFVQAAAEAPSWTEAFRTTYGSDAAALEDAWRSQLPVYLNGSWQRPAAPADAASIAGLAAAGDLDEARRRLAVMLARESPIDSTLRPALGGPGGATSGAAPVTTIPVSAADKGLEALIRDAEAAKARQQELQRAVEALAAGDYARAGSVARRLVGPDPAAAGPEAGTVQEVVARAERGQAALAQLLRAHQRPWWQFLIARHEAFDAAVALAALGNDAAAEDARARVQALDRLQAPLGWGLVLCGAALLALNIRRRRQDLTRRGPLQTAL